jgi:hypothetical protein
MSNAWVFKNKRSDICIYIYIYIDTYVCNKHYVTEVIQK